MKPDFVTIYNSTLHDPLAEFIVMHEILNVYLTHTDSCYPDLNELCSHMGRFIHDTKFNVMALLRGGTFEPPPPPQ